MNCPICQSHSKICFVLKHPVYECISCRLKLAPSASFNHSFESDLNENERVVGLKKLRYSNFEKIVQRISNYFINKNISGLEVGSAYGWFLDVCRKKGIQCIGIEPEEKFHPLYKQEDYKVQKGFYPDVLSNRNERFDFIIFNDVFEHIPDIHTVMRANQCLLRKKGLLIINIPLQGGFFIRLSELIYTLGIKSFLNRMWQFDFHSPHLYYFSKNNLKTLAEQYNFDLLDYLPMNTLDFNSLKERVKSDNKNFSVQASLISNSIFLLRPLLSVSQEDIGCFFFIKQ